MADSQKVTYIGKVDFRNKEVTFGIKEDDRTRHTYVIGKTGMGKSTLLENLAIQDINNGEGLCVIDPHGSMAEKLLDFIPEHRVRDVIYFAPFDADCPVGLNVLEKVTADKRHLVANGLMAAFKKIWVDAWSARMEYILNNIILALLENEGQTLLGINRMLTDKEYRKAMVSNVTDPTVRDFWLVEYANYTERFAQEAAPAIQNKVGQFVGNPLIRNILGQTRTSFDLREVMDKKKILIVNLSKGKVGEGNANLIGALLITKIYLAALSRADAGPYNLKDLPPFYFYVDEFQNFANESFAGILSEARKYKLALTVAHQYTEQMTDEVKAAVFGNVGTMIAFRVGATDAEIFEKEFAPYFVADDIVNLSAYQIYLRLMIDGVGSKPFSARTLDPIPQPAHSFAKDVIEYSRSTYGKSKGFVEEEINRFYQPVKKPEAPKTPSEKPQQTESFSQKDTTFKKEEPRKKEEKRFDDKKNEERRQSRPKDTSSKRQSERRPSSDNGRHERKPNQDVYPNIEVKKDIMFDEKPPMSLKDALAKVMQTKPENKEVEIPVNKEEKTTPEVKEKEEVPETVLKKLVYDEDN